MEYNWKILLIFLGSSLLLQAQSVSAKDEFIVVTELFDRFQYIDQNDELTGYSVAVVNELIALAGDQQQIEIYPWTVAFKKALDQKNTMIFSIARTIDREDKFIWVGRLFHEPIYFWTLKKLNIPEVSNFEDLKSYTIAVVKDANSHDYLLRNDFPNIYVMASTFSNNDSLTRMKMLNGHRADMVIASEPDVVNAIKHIGLGRDALQKVYHDGHLNNDLYIAFNKESDVTLVSKYQKAFKSLEDSGRIKKLKQIWELEQD